MIKLYNSIGCKVLAWIFVILWMITIFTFSSQTGSESGEMSQQIVIFISILLGGITNEGFVFLSEAIRGVAHGMEYMILSLLCYRALSLQRLEKETIITIAFSVSAFYAITDELHQYFIPDRATQISDFIIDCFGAGVGILIGNQLRKKYNLRKRG